MPIGAITGYIDVAQLVLYAFWLFFFGLVFYIRTEDKREGYPLVPDPQVPSEQNAGRMEGFPPMPKPKTFRLADGTTRQAPREDKDLEVKATPAESWPGAPLLPTGNPMLDAVGPAAYTQRPDEPEKTMHGTPRMVPMRVAGEFSVASKDPDPRGMPVVGADGRSGGTVTDIWVDRAEPQIRYLEVEVAGQDNAVKPAKSAESAEGAEGAEGEGTDSPVASKRRVLLPITFSRINAYAGHVKVRSILSSQFADVPTTSSPDQVTQLEEDRISAYYGGGTLYANAERQEPLL